MPLEVNNSPEVGIEGELGKDLEVGGEGAKMDNAEKKANLIHNIEEEFGVNFEEGIKPNISKLLFDKGNGEESRDALVNILKGQGMDVSVPNNKVTTINFGDTEYDIKQWTRPGGPPASAKKLVKALVEQGIMVNGRSTEGEKRNFDG